MKYPTVATFCIVSSLVVGFVLVFALPNKGRSPSLDSVNGASESLVYEYEYPVGSALHVVVDINCVRLGDYATTIELAISTVGRFAKERKIRNILLYATEQAKFGDVVKVYDGLLKTGIRNYAFNTYPIESGVTKPLFGNYKSVCCFSIDVENDIRAHNDI
jgi:hypothetical protein